jgi:hypothetical protein
MSQERRLRPRGFSTGWASTVVVGSITGIALTAGWLPARVASHFGASGIANGFMARETYLAFTIALVVVPPALVSLILALSLKYFPQFLNLPNRDYWLAPERRDETAAYLTAHTAWLAALLSVFAFAIHLLVVRANENAPARLETVPFLAVLVTFSMLMVVWIAALARRFRRD